MSFYKFVFCLIINHINRNKRRIKLCFHSQESRLIIFYHIKDVSCTYKLTGNVSRLVFQSQTISSTDTYSNSLSIGTYEKTTKGICNANIKRDSGYLRQDNSIAHSHSSFTSLNLKNEFKEA